MHALGFILVVLAWSPVSSAQHPDAGEGAPTEKPAAVPAPPPADEPQRRPVPEPPSFTPSETVSADAEVRFPVDI
jgi:hypothetical protein